MRVLVFDLRAPLGHFRRPDTTASHATYPFITRTALRGMIGSILGYEEFLQTSWTGIQLLSPVRICSQELSMLGKGFLGGGGDSMNRPTSIELVVKPAYRIFYNGDDQEKLRESLKARQSYYHTYLGSAYALLVPEFVGEWDLEELISQENDELTSFTVVPSHMVGSLSIKSGREYGRVGGVHYAYLGQRRFRHTLNLIYEVQGNPIGFTFRHVSHPAQVRLAKLDHEGVICLW